MYQIGWKTVSAFLGNTEISSRREQTHPEWGWSEDQGISKEHNEKSSRKEKLRNSKSGMVLVQWKDHGLLTLRTLGALKHHKRLYCWVSGQWSPDSTLLKWGQAMPALLGFLWSFQFIIARDYKIPTVNLPHKGVKRIHWKRENIFNKRWEN